MKIKERLIRTKKKGKKNLTHFLNLTSDICPIWIKDWECAAQAFWQLNGPEQSKNSTDIEETFGLQ